MPRQTKLSVVPDAPIIAGIEPSGFYQTPNYMAMKAIRAKLTSADWCLWSYLQMLDPYGDRLRDIPNPRQLAEIVGLSLRQVDRSLAKLKDLGLYETEVLHHRGQNLAGKAVRELRDKVVSEKKSVDNFAESKTKLSTSKTTLSTDGQSCLPMDNFAESKTKMTTPQQVELLTDKGFSEQQKSYTIKDFNSYLSQTSSDLEAKEEKFNQNQESPENTRQENFPFDQQKTESSVITSISSLDKIRGYSPVVEKSIREMDWELIYDGENTPWLLSPRRQGDVHFHPKFMEWHGYRFKEKFSKPDIHSAIADFRSSLINQPSRIQGRWEEYENHMAQFVENTAAIVEAGVEPSEYAKAKITAHAELIAKCEPVKAMRFSEIPTIQGIDENPVPYLPYKQEELPSGNDVPPTAESLTESCKTALGRRFVTSLIAKNPGWGYEMVDGVVVDKNQDDDDDFW